MDTTKNKIGLLGKRVHALFFLPPFIRQEYLTEQIESGQWRNMPLDLIVNDSAERFAAAAIREHEDGSIQNEVSSSRDLCNDHPNADDTFRETAFIARTLPQTFGIGVSVAINRDQLNAELNSHACPLSKSARSPASRETRPSAAAVM